MRSYSRLIAILLIVAISVTWVFAHPGRTDGKGGHTDRSTGEYHYHHGYPEHQHTNGVCPYDFDDQTGKNSGTSSGRATSTNEKDKGSISNPKPVVTEQEIEVNTVPLWVYCTFAVLLCIVVCLIVDIRIKKIDIAKRIKDRSELLDELFIKEELLKGEKGMVRSLQQNIDRQSSKIVALQSYVSDLVAILEQTRNRPPLDDIQNILSEGLSASDLKLPDDVYFIDGFIPVIGRTSANMPYGDLTVYTSPTGKCYHSNPRCGSGFLRPVHAYDVISVKTPCINCAKAFPAYPPEWYRRIKYIAKNRTTK